MINQRRSLTLIQWFNGDNHAMLILQHFNVSLLSGITIAICFMSKPRLTRLRKSSCFIYSVTRSGRDCRPVRLPLKIVFCKKKEKKEKVHSCVTLINSPNFANYSFVGYPYYIHIGYTDEVLSDAPKIAKMPQFVNHSCHSLLVILFTRNISRHAR